MYCRVYAFCFLLGTLACAQGGVVTGPGHLLNSLSRCFTSTVTKVSCEGVGEDRLMPHPDDCRLFYQCAEEWAICRECPADLHFNPTKHVCDRPWDAGCVLPHQEPERE